MEELDVIKELNYIIGCDEQSIEFLYFDLVTNGHESKIMLSSGNSGITVDVFDYDSATMYDELNTKESIKRNMIERIEDYISELQKAKEAVKKWKV